MSTKTFNDRLSALLERGDAGQIRVRHEHGTATYWPEHDSGREPDPTRVYVCLWNCEFEATGGPIRGSLCATHEDVYRDAMMEAVEAMLGKILEIR